jgi:hypothetical protein
MDREAALLFRDQLKEARAAALRDGEAQQEIILPLNVWGLSTRKHGKPREV